MVFISVCMGVGLLFSNFVWCLFRAASLLFELLTDLTELNRKCSAIAANNPYFRSILLYQNSAPK